MTRPHIPAATLHRIYSESPWSDPQSYQPEPIDDNPPKWFPIMIVIEGVVMVVCAVYAISIWVRP
jgi:hypothetical protein